MESVIFGYNQGAFTGAHSTTIGKLEIANKGTVFLDDIDSLDINMQAKLLRVIQEREFERLGSHKVIKIDVRFLAASNKSLVGLIADGKFREDLFYRLNVFPVDVPPLRERRGDIPLLLNHFLDLYAKKTGKPSKKLSQNAVDTLTRYNWPGNVRELENLVERLCTVSPKSIIYTQDISISHIGLDDIKGMTLKEAVTAFEKQYVQEVLESSGGNRIKAAKTLGIHRNTLLRKMNML
jgi:transcriptional regulator with PAS, ATPase and Fis domain